MSIKEIANIAGTSVATVSRILNNPEYKCSNKELSEKVWEIAKEMNYTPNAVAQNLRKGVIVKQEFVVDIFLTRFHSLKSDLFFEELYEVVRDEILRSNCILGEFYTSVDIINHENSTKGIGHIPYKSDDEILKQLGITSIGKSEQFVNRGLVILGKCPSQIVPILERKYKYIVGIDRNPTEYLYDEVVCDGVKAAEMAVEYLIKNGHRDIAYIGDCTYEARYVGYYQTLLKNRLSLNYTNVFPSGQTYEEGYAIANRIIDENIQMTAIFCANDMTAMGVIAAYIKRKRKNKMPTLISIDNLYEVEKRGFDFTSIDIPKREMGHLAICMLLDRKNGRHTENVRLELPCRIVERIGIK